jgi:probable O-glycosylation ligase (exosortase A-associated)
MIAATAFGTAGVYLCHPVCGVWVYYLFAVLRPQYMWEWSLPAGVNWSFYVAVATILAALQQLGKAPVRWTRSHWFVLAFGGWVALSYVFAYSQQAAYPWFVEYSKIFVMFAACSVLITRIRHLWVLMLLAAASLGYISYEINFLYFVNGYLGIQRNGYGGLDNNGAGLMLAMGVPLCYFAWEGQKSRWRWAFLAVIPVILHAVLMTYSRGAMVSLIAVVPLFVLRSRRRLPLLAFGVVMAFLLPILAGKEIRARFFSIQDNEVDDSANSRRKAWAAAWAITMDNPIIGVGVRNANLFSHRYGADMEGRTIHSQYLQVAADTGFVGVGLYLGAIAAVWGSLRSARRWARDQTDAEAQQAYTVACGVEGALVVFCVGALFLSLEVFELPYLLFLCAAQLAALVRSREEGAGGAGPEGPPEENQLEPEAPWRGEGVGFQPSEWRQGPNHAHETGV